MKRYLLIAGFDSSSTIHNDANVALHFEDILRYRTSSMRVIVANGIKRVWVLETQMSIDEIARDVLECIRISKLFKDLKMTSMEYFEIQTNKVIL